MADGKYGILLDGDGNPLASVMEVLDSLPSVDDPNNFTGRLVFDVSSSDIYIWTDDPSDEWIGLQISNVTVAAPVPTPALNPDDGELYYSTDTEILYLWDGSSWVEVGGKRGASVLWRHYVADGLTDQFSTGATTFPPVEFVQVYLDGEVKDPGSNGVRDYYMVGNDVKLNATPSNGVKVSVRTLTHITAARNSKFSTKSYITNGTDNAYDVGSIAIQPGQIWVTVDGVTQRAYDNNVAGTYDFKINTKDTTISSLAYAGGIVTVTTATNHSFVVGDAVTIFGADQLGYNGTQTVASVTDSTHFTYSLGVDPGASTATTSDTLYYSPIKENDTISFVNESGVATALESGHNVYIQVAENVTVGEVIGEVNTCANVGSGEGIFKEKDDEVINLKTLRAGNRISLSSGPNEITINAQNDTFKNITVVNGVSDSTYTVQTTDHYIAVRNASSGEIVIDIDTNIPTDPSMTGRTLLIKDEAGNAATYNIRIRPNSGSSIEGAADGEDFVMSTNRQTVELIMDGQDWHILRS
jgi:hypothetical protein